MINTRFKARSAGNIPDLLRRVAESSAHSVAIPIDPEEEDGHQSAQKSHSFSTIPHEGLTYKNETWVCVQSAIIRAFKGKQVEYLTAVLLNVRALAKSEVGPFIYDFYKNQMLNKGMMLIKKGLDELEGNHLIEALERVWTRFYTRTLNDIKLILYQIQVQQTRINIEYVTLLAFRKRIVMKTKIRSALLEMRRNKEEPSRVLQQMFSVLQGIKQTESLSECDLQFENLTALALTPYLGRRGVYFGGEEPEYPIGVEPTRKATRYIPQEPPRYTPRQFSHQPEGTSGAGSSVLRKLIKERQRKRLLDAAAEWSRSLEVFDFEMKA